MMKFDDNDYRQSGQGYRTQGSLISHLYVIFSGKPIFLVKQGICLLLVKEFRDSIIAKEGSFTSKNAPCYWLTKSLRC